MKSTQSTADKIKEISKKFDVADAIISDDVAVVLEDEVKNVTEHSSEYNPIDVMSLQNMAEDFRFSRDTLKESIQYGRKVLESATLDLLLSENDKKSGDTMAFAELTTAVLNGVKTYSALYKDFSNTLLNLNKVHSLSNDNIINTNNTVNILENISTVDLIEQLKGHNNN